MDGGHGQIVQLHVVKESKQDQEHVLMMLQTSASHSLSKKLALLPQLLGAHGQVALQHAVMVAKQELEHVLIILQALPMSQKPTKKLATSKNAVMTLGQHGVHGTHAPIMVPFHLNEDVPDVNSSKYRRVDRRVKR